MPPGRLEDGYPRIAPKNAHSKYANHAKILHSSFFRLPLTEVELLASEFSLLTSDFNLR